MVVATKYMPSLIWGLGLLARAQGFRVRGRTPYEEWIFSSRNPVPCETCSTCTSEILEALAEENELDSLAVPYALLYLTGVLFAGVGRLVLGLLLQPRE